MADAFISYHASPETSALVRDIADELESIGVSCWYAPRNVTPGAFVPSILRAIDCCKVFLLILDEGANSSKYVLRETLEAFNREKQPQIIPFKLGTFPVARELNFYLRPIHIFYGGVSVETAQTEELILKISALFDKVPTKIVKRGECGDNVRFTLNENGLLTISGSGPMRDFKLNVSDMPWFNERAMITKVKIQNGVTTIGNGAFRACTALTSVTISESVTKIDVGAFSSCAGLTGVRIPDSVTKIGVGAFAGCATLAGVKIPDRITEISWGTFAGCEALTSVTIPHSVVTIGGWAFADCKALTRVHISKGATTIPYAAFAGCTGLTSVMIPNGVTRIYINAFADCKELKSVDIPDSVTVIDDGAFYACEKLRQVSVPKNANVAPDAFPPSVWVKRRE